MNYTIALGSDLGSVVNKTFEWEQIVERMSRHEVAMTKGGRYLVGGEFNGSQRKEANLLNRSLITLDLDNFEGMSI